jgi:hypothetical protein
MPVVVKRASMVAVSSCGTGSSDGASGPGPPDIAIAEVANLGPRRPGSRRRHHPPAVPRRRCAAPAEAIHRALSRSYDRDGLS